MKALDNKAFTAKLSGVIKSSTALRDNIQLLIEAGLVQVQESGNTVYLSRVMAACVNVRALPTKAIKAYIQAHCSNLKWGKDKAGNMVFSKAVKGTDFEVTEPELKWYESKENEEAQAKPDLDAVAKAKLLFKQISKALEEGKVKDIDAAAKIQKALAEVTA